MKKLLFTSFFLIICAVFVLFRLGNDSKVTENLPKSQVKGENITVVNNWFPKIDAYKEALPFNLSSKSALVVNYDTGEVLYALRAKDRLPVASTVKIMTSLVALERAKSDQVFTVSKKAAEIGEDSMGLTEGEKLKLSELLYGLMLPSGNDAGVTIAEGVSGSEDDFVAAMNQKVKELGLSDTKFINATGLDVDGEAQYSTAYDLATIARYTWEKYPIFRKTVNSDYILIDATNEHKAFELYNDTNLLTTYPGVRGIKPGFTWEAGYCLVTYAENNGVKLLGVILNSADRRYEMVELLDYGFGKYGINVSHPLLPS